MPRTKQRRAHSITPRKRETFLTVLADTAIVRRAAEATGVAREMWYKLRKEDAEFAALWDEAYHIGVAHLEDVAMNRATRNSKPSDLLTIFLLKGGMPNKYREQSKIEHVGAGGAPLPAPTMNVHFVTPEKKSAKHR